MPSQCLAVLHDVTYVAMLLELAQESEVVSRQLQYCCWEQGRCSALALTEGRVSSPTALVFAVIALYST
jgi:hypothetical protein